MSVEADWEPEDSWDADDDRDTLIANLFARIKLLDGLPDYAVRTGDPLDEIQRRLDAWHAMPGLPNARDAVRAAELADDIAYVRSL